MNTLLIVPLVHEYLAQVMLKLAVQRDVEPAMCVLLQRSRRVRKGRVALDRRGGLAGLGAARGPAPVHAVRGLRRDAHDEQRWPHVHEPHHLLYHASDASARAAHRRRLERLAVRAHHPVRAFLFATSSPSRARLALHFGHLTRASRSTLLYCTSEERRIRLEIFYNCRNDYKSFRAINNCAFSNYILDCWFHFKLYGKILHKDILMSNCAATVSLKNDSIQIKLRIFNFPRS